MEYTFSLPQRGQQALMEVWFGAVNSSFNISASLGVSRGGNGAICEWTQVPRQGRQQGL